MLHVRFCIQWKNFSTSDRGIKPQFDRLITPLRSVHSPRYYLCFVDSKNCVIFFSMCLSKRPVHVALSIGVGSWKDNCNIDRSSHTFSARSFRCSFSIKFSQYRVQFHFEWITVVLRSFIAFCKRVVDQRSPDSKTTCRDVNESIVIQIFSVLCFIGRILLTWDRVTLLQTINLERIYFRFYR